MQYKIEENLDKNGKFAGFKLRTWESVQLTSERLQISFFKVNLDFQTKPEAIAYANQIIRNQSPSV